MSKSYLTKEGLKKLKQELDYLLSEGRKESAKGIKAAIDAGGYEDNMLYDIELDKQAQLERRIAEIEEVLRNSSVISESSIDTKYVAVGSTVIVEVEGETDTFRIVGSFEANPIRNLISNESPVGQALLGAKAGDVIEVSTPVVKLKYKVLEIKHD